MRNMIALMACVIVASASTSRAQDPIPILATNNTGFIQNGVNGPDNLVLFEIIPDPMLPPEEIVFSIVGDLTLGNDFDGNGTPDSIGTFSGMEWSSGMPGIGTLIGCVLNEGAGGGEFYQIDPNTAEPTMIGRGPLDENNEPLDFSDLAFNVTDGLMYGLMNDITIDMGGALEFGNVTLWVDTDSDLIPDTQLGTRLAGPDGFCLGTIQTLASGMAFTPDGFLFVYDNVDETVYLGTVDPTSPGDPCVVALSEIGLDDLDTGFASTQTTQGNGLAVADGHLLIGSDILTLLGRGAAVSYYAIPDFFNPPDPLPEITLGGFFATEFFQQQVTPVVSIGDLVGAMADFSGLPGTFPDSITVNNGMPAKNAALEGLALSDDFRYCIFAAPPTVESAPLDLEFTYTLPNPTELTVLGLEIEGRANVNGLRQTIYVWNLTTNQFDQVGADNIQFDPMADETFDDEFTVDLTANIADYVDMTNGTMICRIETRAMFLTLMFPWQMKYDSVLAVGN